MKKSILMTIVLLSVTVMSVVAFASEKGGEATFKAKCASCHPKGGNIMKPENTIKGIKDRKVIINIVRNGGGGMPKFDIKSISDADVKLVADYIIKTFKK